MTTQLQDLPEAIAQELNRFVEAVKTAWGQDLRSIVLYGSAAEGQLRTTSDVNVLVVLRAFNRPQADQIREPLRFARAAIRLGVMFLLESEIEDAAAAFAVKFGDIGARHRILYGGDPFEALEISRTAALARVKQVLLNLRLRLRERYAAVGLREEQLAQMVANMAGPLRTSAATICRLEGRTVDSPKAALELIAKDMNEPRFLSMLPMITDIRTRGQIEAGAVNDLVFTLMDLVSALQRRAERLT
jgi:predicted nucleotidyltransferase